MFWTRSFRIAAHKPRIRRARGLMTRKFERKRIYKEVSVIEDEENPGSWSIRLDHRTVKTPLGRAFLVPSEALALVVAQEWQSQGDEVKRQLMNVTAIVNTVLDEKSGHVTTDALLSYVNSDTVCFRVTEPDDLVARQTQEWDPLIKWFNERFDCNLTSTIYPTISASLPSSQLKRFIAQLDRWALAGFELAVDSTKSLILSCALFEGRIDTQQACDLSRLETMYQAEKWGQVEWHHLVEEKDLKSKLGAAILLKELSYKD